MTQSGQQFEVSDLTVEVFDEALAARRPIVSDLSFVLRAGQGLGITGESGSGKTTLSLALSGLLPTGSRASAVRLNVSDGCRVFTLFQEPRASLNPYRTIAWQLKRCAAVSRGQPTLLSALSGVGLDPDVLRHYPHELSTGMCQRVFLAMASVRGADILVADEPFASVDSETQRRLTTLVRDWMQTRGLMLILVSHDLELLRQMTDQTIVMYRGQVAEVGPTRDLLAGAAPVHPYTWLLEQVGSSAFDSAAIPQGNPPGALRAACRFAPRCAWADPQVCVEAVPPLRAATEQPPVAEPAAVHRLRCLRHPIAEQRKNGSNDQPSNVCHPPDSALATRRPEDGARELVRACGLAKDFRTGWISRRTKRVVEDVTFSVFEAERLGVMGPSGQGKTTLARLILGLLKPDRGSVQISIGDRWTDPARCSAADRRLLPRRVQMLYQDTDLVLDPAARVADTLLEAYRVFDPRQRPAKSYRLAAQLLEELALPASLLEAYPYRLSGGERKRVALARALAAFGCPFAAGPDDPWRLLVLDEPTAGVDVVLQAILARFLIWAQPRLRLSYLVISHDESFVRRFCCRALWLSNGRVSPAATQCVAPGP